MDTLRYTLFIHKKYLEYAGLSEKESDIYLALLKTDTISAIELARATSLKKSIVYVILESLVKRGLVKEITVGKRIQYRAESPDVLRMIIQDKRNRVEEETRRLETIITELKTIERDLGERPVVQFYEGHDAVKHSIEEYVSAENFSNGKDYGIYSYDLMEKIFTQKDIETIDKNRVEHNTVFKAIYTGINKVIESKDNQILIKIDQDRFPILCDIGIFNDEVRIHTLGKKPYGIFVKNKEIATTLKSLIEYIFAQKSGN
jgi:sugar-specific transcriptional regulator TrmB